MTPDMEALARRAVACKSWRWMPGMADRFGRRVMQVYPDELGFKWSHLLENNVVRDADALPDLTDPATLGCMMALVREVWKSPVAQTSPTLPDIIFWTCYINNEADGDHRFRAKTEGEALVMALESAP